MIYTILIWNNFGLVHFFAIDSIQIFQSLYNFISTLVCDGANEYTEESDTETHSDSDFEYSDTESGPSDIEQLCKTTEKLNM